MAETTNANKIIEYLKDQANSVLGQILGGAKLVSFNVGQLGNMPYYWQNPMDTSFNLKTYQWIAAALKAKTEPKQLDQPFINQFIDVFGKINYSLSKADQDKLNKAFSSATNQQVAVLNAWRQAFGGLPQPTKEEPQPITAIMTIVATTWASPATTLDKMQKSTNLSKLLNATPPSGKPVVPVIANWLNALGASISLVNATTMNTGYLSQALSAAQEPSADNGGMLLDDSKEIYHPAYSMAAGSSLSAILNGLKNSGSKVEVEMSVSRSSESEYQISITGGASFGIPILGFFTVNVGGHASYFQSDIATTSNTTTVRFSYPGVTLVNFGPSAFDQATTRNWYWTTPITEAIKNGDQDVSGFKFSPKPNIDFGPSGPFGYLQGAAIANYPTVTIKVQSSNYKRIEETFQQSASVGLSFLGIPLGIGGSEGSYSNKVEVDQSESTVTITLSPPQELVAGTAVDSVGWVLGVQPVYPAAS